MPRRNKLQPTQPTLKDGKKCCCFCGLPDDNEVEFGKFYEYQGIVTHYYCLLLSSNMEQKGGDDQGILGFLADDIIKEIRRGKRLNCSHCKKNGATLGCCNVKCKRIFHLPCGLKNGSLHQFFGEFRSYCINHRPKQKIDEKVKNEVKNNRVNVLCYICYENVEPFDSNGTLWAPCCKKNAWFHRTCVQQLAMSAGYFFKCPLCNNKREFQTAMLEYGIYIPRQDASWELVPNAFQELLYRHDRCDAQPCLCPKGRTYSASNAKWELVLCRLCGSQGIHISCGQLKLSKPVWECQECIAITKKSSSAETTPNDSTTSSNNPTIPRANITLNITVTENEDDSDSDISVGNDSPLVNSLDDISTDLPPIKLRPGPRSFKLQQVQKIKNEAVKESITISHDSIENSNNTNKNIRTTALPVNISADVICIDSDDESPQIVCESGMKGIFKKNSMKQFNYHRNNASGSSSSGVSKSMPFVMKNQMFNSTVDLSSSPSSTPPPLIEETETSPFNFVISNVTSVPAEFFASVPDSPTDDSTLELPTLVSSSQEMPKPLKRNHQQACDEENDYQVVVEAPKRARLDTTIDLEPAKADDKLAPPHNGSSLPENSGKAVAPPPLIGPSNASAAPENCHGDAGTSPAVAHTTWPYDDSVTVVTTPIHQQPDEPRPSDAESTNGTNGRHEPSICATNSPVSTNGPSSFSDGNSGNGRSTESRSSSCDRSGLIPDLVLLSDLKFKISGNDLELAYRSCKIQMKMSDMQSINSSSNDTGNCASVSSTGSNQNISSEKSSKSFLLRSDDSDESSRILRLSRSRGPRSFVYEDDNTLLEYPTTQTHNNAGNSKESLVRERGSAQQDHHELKENWDPEVSSSSNHLFDSPMSNQFTPTPKDNNVNSPEKSSRSENDSEKDDSITNQLARSLRPRSGRLVRHFHSVQKASKSIYGHINGIVEDTAKFKPIKYFPIFEQRYHKTTQSRNNSNTLEEYKHLKNVNMNDLRFTLTGKVKEMRDVNKYDVDVFKVSIDLQKIKNLITDKPDLFFKTKSEEYESMYDYKMGEKLPIELKSGERKMLTKSRSYECLLDLEKYHSHSRIIKRCKSSDSLCHGDVNDSVMLTDIKDCKEKVVTSQRRKTRQFDKNEC